MPSFQYRARDRQGGLVTGMLDAASRPEVETTLDKMGLIPIRVEGTGGGARLRAALMAPFDKVTQQDIIIFSRQLATLFGAGVHLLKALNALEKQSVSTSFARVIKAIRVDIEAGSSLSAAIARHGRVFPEFYPHMVEAGEAGGILEPVLERVAAMLETNAENAARVRSAMLYPKIVVGAIVVAVIVLMKFVVPRFAAMYSSFNIPLPLPTRMLIVISYAFTNYWHYAVALAAAAYTAFLIYRATPSGRLRMDAVKLGVPVFGPIVLKSTISRFCRILGSLYKSGLPILQALDITSRAVGNSVISAEIKIVENAVRAGKTMAAPIGEAAHFPPLVAQMAAVGEETGNLDAMLNKAAEYYDNEVASAIRNLTTTLEPILLSFIFVMVLFLALAIFLPMWDILKVVKR